MPDKDIGLQGTGVHISDSHQHIPQSGVSDFCNFFLGEQPKLEKAKNFGDGKGLQASRNLSTRYSGEDRDPEGLGRRWGLLGVKGPWGLFTGRGSGPKPKWEPGRPYPFLVFSNQ